MPAADIIRAATEGVNLIYSLAGAAFGIGILYYIVVKIDQNAHANVTDFFSLVKRILSYLSLLCL
jgi:hypothetical protein